LHTKVLEALEEQQRNCSEGKLSQLSTTPLSLNIDLSLELTDLRKLNNIF